MRLKRTETTKPEEVALKYLNEERDRDGFVTKWTIAKGWSHFIILILNSINHDVNFETSFEIYLVCAYWVEGGGDILVPS